MNKRGRTRGLVSTSSTGDYPPISKRPPRYCKAFGLKRLPSGEAVEVTGWSGDAGSPMYPVYQNVCAVIAERRDAGRQTRPCDVYYDRELYKPPPVPLPGCFTRVKGLLRDALHQGTADSRVTDLPLSDVGLWLEFEASSDAGQRGAEPLSALDRESEECNNEQCLYFRKEDGSFVKIDGLKIVSDDSKQEAPKANFRKRVKPAPVPLSAAVEGLAAEFDVTYDQMLEDRESYFRNLADRFAPRFDAKIRHKLRTEDPKTAAEREAFVEWITSTLDKLGLTLYDRVTHKFARLNVTGRGDYHLITTGATTGTTRDNLEAFLPLPLAVAGLRKGSAIEQLSKFASESEGTGRTG